MPQADAGKSGTAVPGLQNQWGVFLAGAVSGISEGVTVQPLELLKTRFQVKRLLLNSRF